LLDLAGNPFTSLLPASLPSASLLPASLLPAFKPPVSSSLFIFKKFDYYCASISLKRQADKITTQNIQYKIAIELYVLIILF